MIDVDVRLNKTDVLRIDARSLRHLFQDRLFVRCWLERTSFQRFFSLLFLYVDLLRRLANVVFVLSRTTDRVMSVFTQQKRSKWSWKHRHLRWRWFWWSDDYGHISTITKHVHCLDQRQNGRKESFCIAVSTTCAQFLSIFALLVRFEVFFFPFHVSFDAVILVLSMRWPNDWMEMRTKQVEKYTISFRWIVNWWLLELSAYCHFRF